MSPRIRIARRQRFLARSQPGLSPELLEKRELLDAEPPWMQFPYDALDVLVADDQFEILDDPIADSQFGNGLSDGSDGDGTGSGGPAGGGGPNFPQGVAGAPAESFPVDQLQYEFMVFDDIAFDDVDPMNRPDLAQVGLKPLTRHGTWHFFTSSSGLSEPDFPRLRNFARQLDPRQLFVINIEHWHTSGSEEVVAESIAKLKSVIDAVREENPSIKLGIYSMFPVRDYFTPVTHGYGTTRYENWSATNRRLQELADQVDVILPSIYTFYPDYNEDGSERLFERDRWVAYATANLLEARQYGKPVVSYIWPMYHGGGGSADPESPNYRYWKYQPIGGEFWNLILETTRQYSDGAVIWGGSDTIWDDAIPWWTETVAWMDEISPSYAVSESTLAGHVVAGTLADMNTHEAATVTIHVTEVNDAPVARNDSFFTSRNTGITIDVLADNGAGADADVDGTLLSNSVILTAQPDHGTLTLSSNNTFLYLPDADFFGVDRARYTVRDDDNAVSNEATITIVVNSPPQAADDLVSTPEDTPRTIFVLGANGGIADVDVDGNINTGSLTLVAGPQHGTVTAQPGGAFLYTPDPDYFGTDQFTYTVRDTLDELSNVATVTINVTPVNDPPRTRNDEFAGREDESIPIDVWQDNGFGIDFDLDGTLLQSSLSLVTPPANGSLYHPGDGSLVYTPAPDFHGTDQFSYRVQDNQGAWSAPATVTIVVDAVNDPPHAMDDFVVTARGVPIDIDVLQQNGKQADYDVDDAMAGVTVVTGGKPMAGSVSTGDGLLLRYTPAPGFQGIDTFRYEVTDGTGEASNQATVSVLVTDPPIARDDLILLAEDESVRINVLADNGEGRDYDPDGSLRPSAIVILDEPAHGVLVNHRDGTFTYTPAPEYSGLDSFTYAVPDNYLSFSAPATVQLEIARVNDRPVARDDVFRAPMNDYVPFDLLADNGNGPDVDPEDTLDPLAIQIVDPPDHGTLQLQTDGTWRYLPDPLFLGVDTFTYTVTDGEGLASHPATVRIEVSDYDPAPTAQPDALETQEDQPLSVPLWLDHGSGVDSDLDGSLDLASVQIAAPPQFGTADVLADGTVLYTPAEDFFGEDTFSYTIADNHGRRSQPAAVTILVQPINDAPIAIDDAVTTLEDVVLEFDVRQDLGAGPDRDVDDDFGALQVIVEVPPENGSLQALPDGSLRYQPNVNFFGSDAFRYALVDASGARSETATVTIVVQAVNDPPLAVEDRVTTAQSTPILIDVLVPNGLQGQADSDVDDLISPNFIGLGAAPSHGQVSLDASGRFLYEPDAGFHGEDQFTYVLTDPHGAASEPATVIIHVNNPPTAAQDLVATDEDTAVEFDVIADNGAGPDTDSDGIVAPNSLEIVSQPEHGSLDALGGGQFRFTPDLDYFGNDTFTYRVLDDDGAVSNLGTVQITIRPVADAPVAQPDFVQAIEDLPVVIRLLDDNGSGPDQDVDGILIPESVVVQQPQFGTLALHPDGTVTYYPHENFVGQDQIRYQVSDSQGLISNEAIVTIDVLPAVSPPQAQHDVIVTSEDKSITFNVLNDHGAGADFDADGVIVAATVNNISLPISGTLTNLGNGSFRYRPALNFSGTVKFQYSVRDDQGALSGNYQVLREQLDASGTTSELEHRWVVPAKGVAPFQLFVTGHHTSDAESFRFDYSTDGIVWHPTTIELTNASQVHTHTIDAPLSGNVLIRVVDTNRTSGENTLDYVLIDELYLRHSRPINPALPVVRVEDVVVEESVNSGLASVLITRTGDLSKAVTLAVETVAETATAHDDFEPVGLRTVTIAAGATSISLPIAIVDDAVPEWEETFLVRISSALNATVIAPEGRVTIAASDSPAGPTSPAEQPSLPTSSAPSAPAFPSAGGVDAVFAESVPIASPVLDDDADDDDDEGSAEWSRAGSVRALVASLRLRAAQRATRP